MTTITHVTSVRGESFAISGFDGNIVPGGDHGFYVRDVRFLDQLELLVNGADVVGLSRDPSRNGHAVFHGCLPPAGRDQTDAEVRVTRSRQVDGGMLEQVVWHNAADSSQPLMVQLRLGTDFANIFDVRHRRTLQRTPATSNKTSVVLRRDGGREKTLVTITMDDPRVRPVITAAPGGATVWLQFDLPARGARSLRVELTAHGNFGTVEPDGSGHGGGSPEVLGQAASDTTITTSDSQLQRLLDRSTQDLRSLVMADPRDPQNRFAAAGSPWFLTLFGRDSLWAALMALPLDPTLALGTLHTLAARQGTRVDEETEEQPGKILHEVRHGAMAERGDLPPHYYGSIDATPLFVILAHEVWRWGAPDDSIKPLIDHVDAALQWITEHGDPDGDGFLEYLAPAGRGLANQGWKDSKDGIRFANGRIARAPMALAEVQGYAFAAARGGADLLEHFGRSGATRWRDWADQLAQRFRDRFWISDDDGPYPAVALDADKVPVDSIASNMGHLLFTGLLEDDEARLVGQRLVSPDMAAGFGLRTLSSRSGGYNPMSYHCGSVWPHDTAIAAWGLGRTGQDVAALTLIRQVTSAAAAFGDRLPELFSGLGTRDAAQPVPYPSACRPQAWAAGAGLLMARTLCGLEPDVPAGQVTIRPLVDSGLDHLDLQGLSLGPRSIDVRVANGTVRTQGCEDLRVASR